MTWLARLTVQLGALVRQPLLYRGIREDVQGELPRRGDRRGGILFTILKRIQCFLMFLKLIIKDLTSPLML